jgi:ApaG protein
MFTCSTNGITVSVDVQYLPEHSNPRGQKFIFGYHIRIDNGTPFEVQLLRRYWHITDAHGTVREVDGDGVVGRQPVFKAGESHEYMSFCNIYTEMGKMSGRYEMIRLSDNMPFDVEIPEFQMISPVKMN